MPARLLRISLSLLLSLALFLLLARLLHHWYFLVMRELYTFADRAGWLPQNASGAMQILGQYISGPPPWLRRSVLFLSAWIGLGPALWSALLAHRRVCLRFPVFRRRGWGRLALATTVFAGLYLLSEPAFTDHVRNWAFDLGALAGCEYFVSGGLFIGENGPFFGGPVYPVFNLAWTWGPWIVPTVLPFLFAFALDHVLTRRTIAHPGRCRRCDYRLDANTSGVCPECGTSIA